MKQEGYMFEQRVSLEDICTRFNTVRWHDSKLIGLRISPTEDGLSHNVCFDIRLLTNSQPSAYEGNDEKLIMKDCRIIKLDLDLLGKQLCGGDIASAFCEKESPLKQSIEDEQLTHFDLPQEESLLAEYLHFRILLIHPGGEINVFARNFELVS